MKKRNFIFTLFIALLSQLLSVTFIFADEENAYNKYVYPKAVYKPGIDAPFNKEKAVGEKISTLSGELELEFDDMTLKGINGLDLTIRRYYSSSQAGLKQPNVKYETSSYIVDGYELTTYWYNEFYDSNGTFKDSNVNTSVATYTSYSQAVENRDFYLGKVFIYKHDDGTQVSECYDATIEECQVRITSSGYKHSTIDITHSEKMYRLGSGWALDFPSLELRDNAIYLHYGSAGTWQVDLNGSTQSKLVDYNATDMKFISDSSYINGQNYTSAYALVLKDGKTYYFYSDGRLLGIRDRFGNKIDFQHTLMDGTPVITKIIDSATRQVNIIYDDINYKVKIEVNDPIDSQNSRTIIYNKLPISNYSNEYYLESVEDSENRKTTYEYKLETAYYNFLSKNAGAGSENIYANLTKIKYSTGGETNFNYSKYTKNLGIEGEMQFYKIFERYDSKGDEVKYKYRQYNYRFENTGEIDGYPSYYSAENIPVNYEIKTQVVSNLSNTIKNNEVLKYNKNMLLTNIVQEGADHKSEIINEYELTYKTLTKIINKIFNKSTGKYLEKIENFEYNSDKNLTGYWGSKASRDVNGKPINNEHKVTYAYSPLYSLLTSKIYKKDVSTVIKEEFVLNPNNLVIEWYKVFANDVKKSQTQYIHDNFGNVTEERNYYKNWTDNYLSTIYTYKDNESARGGKLNNVYLTSKKYIGVEDVDGKLIVAKTGNNPGEIEETFKYNYFGNLVEKQDGNGNIIKSEYDKLGRIKKIVNSDDSSRQWDYDDINNITTVTDERTNSLSYHYDKLGNLEYEKDPISNQNLNTYTYDDEFRIKTESNHNTSMNSRIITYNYNSDGRAKNKKVQDKLNKLLYEELYIYDDAFEIGSEKFYKITKKITGDNNSPSIISNVYIDKHSDTVAESKIHKVNNIEKEYKDTFVYDYVGNKIQEKLARAYDEIWPQQFTSSYEYDYAGRVVIATNNKGDYTTTIYDALGRVESVKDMKANKQTTAPYMTKYGYDNAGRLIFEEIPFEKTTSTDYASTLKKYRYDRNGNKVEEQVTNNKVGESARFKKIGYEYNTRNLLVKVITYDKNLPENYTQYFYDAVGNKVRMYTGLNKELTINGLDNVVDTGDPHYSETRYDYDRFNRLVTLTDAMRKVVSYKYDMNGNLEEQIDKNLSTIKMMYDGLGRLLTKQVTSKNPEANASYSYSYTLTGNKLSASGGGINTTYSYDDLGRLKFEVQNNGIVKEYDYDANNNLKLIIIKVAGVEKSKIIHQYDNMNRLLTTEENGQLIATYDYDENGNRKSLILTNNHKIGYEYSLANKLKSLVNKLGDTTVLSSYMYEYQLDGNIVTKTDHTNKISNYVYDDLGRLQTEKELLNNILKLEKSYTYDDNNNRETLTINDGSTYTITYGYDKNNRLCNEKKQMGTLTEITKYIYDENGNQLSKSKEIVAPINAQKKENYGIALLGTGGDISQQNVELYRYDGFNQLISTEVNGIKTDYKYNADGQRISKQAGTSKTSHVWVGDQVTLDLDANRNVINKYIRGTSLIAYDKGGKERFYYLFNGHGDVVQLTDNVGKVVEDYDYDSFGNEKNINTEDNNPFRYSGEYYDKETRTYYLRARYYDPEIGRFISEDSYRGKAEDPLSLNLYTYCNNNPIKFTDPTGHFPVPLIVALLYLAETALETAPDVVLDVVLEGSNFNLGKSVLTNYTTNLVPVGGEAYTAGKMINKTGDVIKVVPHSKIYTKVAKEISGTTSKVNLRRPYIRKHVRAEVEARAPKTVDGKFIDPNTRLPIEGKYDLGHKSGYEFWREKAIAESEGLTQKEFNDKMNNPNYYQIEDPISNRSHLYEMD